MKTFGAFDVLEDGTLSLDGQTIFPIYGCNGGLTTRTVSYKLVGDKVVCSDPAYPMTICKPRNEPAYGLLPNHYPPPEVAK